MPACLPGGYNALGTTAPGQQLEGLGRGSASVERVEMLGDRRKRLLEGSCGARKLSGGLGWMSGHSHTAPRERWTGLLGGGLLGGSQGAAETAGDGLREAHVAVRQQPHGTCVPPSDKPKHFTRSCVPRHAPGNVRDCCIWVGKAVETSECIRNSRAGWKRRANSSMV